MDGEEHPDDESSQHIKLMKTEATGGLEGKHPQQKWHTLFKMFQEWKRETSIAQGQYALRGEASGAIEEEITKVRAAIHSLQQKKSLPSSEQQLLNDLQQRLQQLIKAQKTLANA